MSARAVAVAVLLAAGVAHAQAYSYLDFRMINSAQDPFPYWVDDQNLPLSPGAVVSATQAAFSAWDDVGCASTAFEYQGVTSSNAQIADPEDPNDSFNVSTNFVVDANDPNFQYALGGGAAFGSSVELTYAGTLYQCDIYLNDVPDPDTGARPRWTTTAPTPSDGLDVQTFVAHEVGHCQGLGHSLDVDDIMRPDLTYGVRIPQPSDDDQGALCYAYPVDGRIGSPCPPATCDQGLTCVTPPRADGGTFPPICTAGCTPGDPNTGCPMPYACQASSAVQGFTGACLPIDGNVTQVGKACGSQPECGSAVGICESGGALPSGYPAWPNGYCAQDCTNDPCPPESACTDYGSGIHLCMKSCRVGSGDCRDGYTCADTSAAPTPVCINKCHGDADCASGYQCRTCDGVCLAVNTPGIAIGSPCTQDSQCGFGQTCFLNGATTGVCSQGCATSCGACPDGTTCHAVGAQGDLMCLRDCATGTCASGEQCADTSTGKGCLPGCTQDAQCPVGDVCNGGECVAQVSTEPDAGCTGCTPDAGSDAGTPVNRPDAGTGSGSTGASGCEVAGDGSFLALIPWLLVFCAWRKRSWQNR